MTNQRTIKPKSEFKFWFVPECADMFGIFLNNMRIGYIEEVGTIHITDDAESFTSISADDYHEIEDEFNQYIQSRPEYLLSVSADYLMTKIGDLTHVEGKNWFKRITKFLDRGY